MNVAAPHPLPNADFMRVLREASGIRVGPAGDQVDARDRRCVHADRDGAHSEEPARGARTSAQQRVCLQTPALARCGPRPLSPMGSSHIRDGRRCLTAEGEATHAKYGELINLHLLSPTVRLSAASGLMWALIAWFIGYRAFGYRIWGGIVMAPLIGILIGRLSWPMHNKPRWVQIAGSLFYLYVAAVFSPSAWPSFLPFWDLAT